MRAGEGFRLGLVIRSAPFQGRAAKDQLDIALAAATLDYELELFFIGRGALQLLGTHDPTAAHLPRGSRGWKSLPGLTGVKAWIEPGVAATLDQPGQSLLLPAQELAPSLMAERLAACSRAWVV